MYKNILEGTQLTHLFYAYKDLGQGRNKINSPYITIIKSFTKLFLTKYKIKTMEIFRAKVNLQLKLSNGKKHHHNTPHKDFENPFMDHNVLLYYVNDSDGDTHFFKGTKIVKSVSPKANRLVFFEGDVIHTGMSPNKHKNRIIINSNFGFASKV